MSFVVIKVPNFGQVRYLIAPLGKLGKGFQSMDIYIQYK